MTLLGMHIPGLIPNSATPIFRLDNPVAPALRSSRGVARRGGMFFLDLTLLRQSPYKSKGRRYRKNYEFSQPLSGDRYPNIAWPHHARKRHKRPADGQLNARRAAADGRLHASVLDFRHFPDGQGYGNRRRIHAAVWHLTGF